MRWKLSIILAVTFSMALRAFPKDTKFIVEIKANNASERSEIAQIINIDSVRDDRVFSVINKFDFDNILKRYSEKILSWELIGDKISTYYKDLVDEEVTVDFPKGDEAFHTYDELNLELNKLADTYSGWLNYFSLGKSIEGRDILGLKITDGEGDKPAIAYFGTHHAREHVSTEIALLFANELLNRSASDSEIKDLLK